MSEQSTQTQASGPVTSSEQHGVVSVTSWLLYLIVLSIPLINIVMLFVWAFGNGNKNKSNLAKASLILMVVYTILFIILSFMIGSFITGILGEFAV